jgi:hypothetical protein
MSQAGSQAWAFYRDVARNHRVWTIRDNGGFPQPATSEGRAQPFWSSLSRVRRIIKTVPAYSAFEPYEITWEDFCERWVPGLTRDNVLVGVNWSGPRAVGYDMDPARVQQCVEALIQHPDERV